MFARFKEIPFSAVTLEYFLLLPVSAIIGYLVQQHVCFWEKRWCTSELPLENLRKLYNLPAWTKVHYTDWMAYLIDMVHYLYAIVYLKDDSYSLLRCNILDDPIRLTTFGASMFVQHHFPLEHSRPSLLSPRSIQEMCLSNALKCRQCCYISLRQGISQPSMEPILRLRYGGLSDRSKRPQSRTRLFDFTLILHGPCRPLPHFLSGHELAIALYGTSVHTVTAGVHRLMVAGCLLYLYMLLQGRRYIDKHIPSSFLAHMLHVEGVLAPPRLVLAQNAFQFIFW